MGLFDTNAPQEPKRSIFDSGWENAEQPLAEERQDRIAPTSVLTLLGGVLSILAFFSAMFLFIPWVTLMLAALSLFLIVRSEKTLSGTRLVFIGTFLAILPLVAIPISDAFFRHAMIRQGREFASLILHSIQKGNTTALHQLNTPWGARKPVSSDVAYWNGVFSNMSEEDHMKLHTDFLSHPLLLTLTTLGEDVTISYYKALPILPVDDVTNLLPLVYSATFTSADGEKESFFFILGLKRFIDPNEKVAMWAWSSFGNTPLDM